MRYILTALFLILNVLVINSQTDSLLLEKLSIKAYVTDKDSQIEKSRTQFQLDSLNIKSYSFDKKVHTEVSFDHNSLRLFINYYFDNEELYLIRVKEESPMTRDFKEIFKITEFYFIDQKLIDNQTQYGFPSCMGLPTNFEEYFKYNPNYTISYLEDISIKILRKL